MDNEKRYYQLLDNARLSALRSYGVDNWSFYEDACDTAIEEGIDIDSDEFLAVLEQCGVDNWDGYSIAIASNRAYEDYLNALDDIDKALSKDDFEHIAPQSSTQEDPAPKDDEPKHVPDKHDMRVIHILAEQVDYVDEDEFLAFMKKLKSRTWHSADFDYAKNHVDNSIHTAKEFKEQALSLYMNRLSDEDILHDWYEFEING